MKLRHRTLLLIAICCALVLPGCAQNLPPTTSPEGKVAIYAREALTITDGVLDALDKAGDRALSRTTDPAIKSAIAQQVIDVAQIIKQIGNAGKDLSVALRAFDAVKSAAGGGSAAERVRAVVKTIQDLIPTVSGVIKDPQIRDAVAAALQTVTTLLLQVSGQVEAFRPAHLPPQLALAP